MAVYGVVAVVGFVAGWAAKRYHHETDSDVAKAKAEGRAEGVKTGRQQGIETLAEHLSDVCDERNVALTGDDPATEKPRPYSLGELVVEATERID